MRWRSWETDPPPLDARVQLVRRGEPEPIGCYWVSHIDESFNTAGLMWRADPLSNPTVQAILDAWPGSRITAIREPRDV